MHSESELFQKKGARKAAQRTHHKEYAANAAVEVVDKFLKCGQLLIRGSRVELRWSTAKLRRHCWVRHNVWFAPNAA